MFTCINLLAALASVASAAVHMVDVGESGQRFTPETLQNVREGDTIVFHLYPNHNVIEGDFDEPCRPDDEGFYSGEYSGTDNGKKRFVVNVTTDDPMYWYCSVDKHCESGMVGGANLPSQGETLDAYKDRARSVSQSEKPNAIRGGQLLEQEQVDKLTQSGDGTSPTAAPSGTGTTASASTTAPGATSGTAAPTTSGAADTIAVGGATTGLFGVVFAVMGWLV